MDLMDRGNLAAAIRQGAFLDATGEGIRPVSGGAWTVMSRSLNPLAWLQLCIVWRKLLSCSSTEGIGIQLQ